MDAFSEYFATFVRLVINNYSSEPWMPPLIIGCYGLCAYVLMPDFDEADGRKLLGWHIVLPMLVAGSAVGALLQCGAPADPALLALGIALMAAFMMGNMSAVIVRAIPLLIADPHLRHAARVQPIGFLILLTLAFCITYQMLTLITV